MTDDTETLHNVFAQLAVTQDFIIRIGGLFLLSAEDPHQELSEIVRAMRKSFDDLPNDPGARAFRKLALRHVDLLETRLIAQLPMKPRM